MIDGIEGVEDTLQLVDHELEHLAQVRADQLMGSTPISLEHRGEAARYVDLIAQRTRLVDLLDPRWLQRAADTL